MLEITGLFTTIMTSVITSGILVGIVKIILDRSLTHKLNQFEQKYIAQVTEQYRIRAKIFDDRYAAYRKISRLIATALERSKLMVIFAEKGWLRDFYSYAESMYQIKSSLISITTNYRAVIEEDMRDICGDAVNVTNTLANMYSLQEDQLPDFTQMNQEHIERLKRMVNKLMEIDSSLENFVWVGIEI